jgi:APA family basic amino acid/polyamine antiporter
MLWEQLFARKSIEQLREEMKGENRLRRVLGPIGLTSLGVGAIIGSGIFVTTGEAAATKAGPAVMLSFLVAGLGCALAALCYAEFAAMVPVAGSAYTYAYATLGELFAWIIGWDLILEYAMSCAVLAADWTKYFNEWLEILWGKDWRIPAQWATDPFSKMPGSDLNGTCNLVAVLVMAACTVVLVIGIRESVTFNAILVGVKVGVVLFIIAVGVWYVSPRNWFGIPVSERQITDTEDLLRRRPDIAALIDEGSEARFESGQQMVEQHPRIEKIVTPEELRQIKELKSEVDTWGAVSLLGVNRWLGPLDDKVRNPFIPYGLSGIMVAAAAVFFAYLGFDSISTHAEEAKQPQRDVPFGILVSLILCTILYLLVSAVITGLQPYPKIDKDAAVAVAFKELSQEHESQALRASAWLIATGALAGMTSVILITFLSQARIFLAMARDGLLPPSIFGAVHPRFRTPHRSTILTGLALCLVTAFTPIHVLFNMVNIGTLLAFIIVCAAVLILRFRRPDEPRPFRCPWAFVLAPLGILVNLLMMLFLPLDTWFRLIGWLVIGFVIYFGYGFRRTLLCCGLWARHSGVDPAHAEAGYYRSAFYRRRLAYSLGFCAVLFGLATLGTAWMGYLLRADRLQVPLSLCEPKIAFLVSAGLCAFLAFMAVTNFVEWKKLRAS